MQIRHKYFPYPVIAEGNLSYENTEFMSDADVTKDGYNLIFSLQASVNNDKINDLIKENKTSFVHHIDCVQTCYRAVITTDEENVIHTIHESKLNGIVQVCTLLVAMEDIQSYKNNSFSSDYKGFNFNIEKGCILGIAKQIVLTINKEKDDLENTDSIFIVTPMLDPNEIYVKVNTINKKKIEIKLPQETWNRYKAMSKITDLESTMHAMLITPVLMTVFHELEQSKEDIYNYNDYRWYRALKNICQKHGVDFDNEGLSNIDGFALAQKILDAPIIRSINFLSNSTGGDL